MASRVGPVISKLHGLASLLLHHLGACSRALAIGTIPDAKLNEVARPELAVDAEVEEGKVPHTKKPIGIVLSAMA